MRITRRGVDIWRVGFSLFSITLLAPPAWGQSGEEAQRLNREAEELYRQDKYRGAIPPAQKAITIFEQAPGKDHPAVGTNLKHLATVYVLTDKGERLPISSEGLDNLLGFGLYYLGRREYRQAAQQFLLALMMSEERGEADYTVASYIGLGLSLERVGHYPLTKESFRTAIELIEKQRRDVSLSGRWGFLSEKAGARFSRLEPYEGMIRALLKERKEGYERETLRYAERVKSRTFLDLLAGRESKGRRAADQQVLAHDKRYQRQLIELTRRLTDLQRLGAKAPQEETGRLQLELAQQRSEYEQFLTEVKLKELELAFLDGTQAVSIERLQSLLDPDTTLLEYYTAKDRLYAWLVNRDTIQVQEIVLSADALEREVNGLLLPNFWDSPRDLVIALPTGEAQTPESASQEREHNRLQFTQQTEALAQKILAPLMKGVKTEKLLVVPHGVLHKLPFAALSDEQGLLLERHSLTILPAFSILPYLVQRRNPDQGRLLALANPVIDHYLADHPGLPYTETEVEQVSRYFSEKRVYQRREATAGVIRRQGPNADVLHLAVPGEFNERQPWQSSLLLAKDQDHGGVLQVHDLFELDLRETNLVVANACVTVPSQVAGADELAGLSLGFIYAGTPSVLATLWPADDPASVEFTARFYENWRKQGLSKAEALRQAQRSVRAMPQYQHPYYWAPFVLIGDWR